MNIAMVHYMISGTAGVALEIKKWKRAFEELGNKVFLLGEEGLFCSVPQPSLSNMSYLAQDFYAYTFEGKATFPDERSYKEKVLSEAKKSKKVIEDFVDLHSIDLIIPQNIWSVAMNISVAIAMQEVIQEKHLLVIAQHHDFFWERPNGVKYMSPYAKEISEKYIPPTNPEYIHVVINHQGHDSLLRRKSLESTIIPNVFDFKAQSWKIDCFNMDYKDEFDFSPCDIIILQATRIVERKGIELAIDFVSKLNIQKENLIGKKLYDGRIFKSSFNFVLVLSGYDTDDGSDTYLDRLKTHAREMGVDLRVISSRISDVRKLSKGVKTYNIWDTYLFCDLITYPSYWEGWGNQFLEGLFAKVPMVVYEYPVFKTEIKDRGFDYISLGSSYVQNRVSNLISIDDEILERAAQKAILYLFDKEKRTESVEMNFKIGEKFFSMENLKSKLSKLLIEVNLK